MLIERFADVPPPQDSIDFLSRLTLKQIDRDVFTGWCHAGSPLRAFGGQVAAQALVAAGATVDDPRRRVHSLHSYFLRPGRTTDHIVYMVDRPRDGRAFSTRRVRAVQYGETIFTMSASFAIEQTGPRHQRSCGRPGVPNWWGDLPAPESIAPESIYQHVTVAVQAAPEDRAKVLIDAGYPEHQLLDLRVIQPEDALELSGGTFDRMVWLKAIQDLSDNYLPHVCATAYFSDLTLVSTVLGHHGGREAADKYEIASLDHAMWFHQPFRADKWMLFGTDSPAAGHGHGFARGQFFRGDGVLSISVAQEALLRDPPR